MHIPGLNAVAKALGTVAGEVSGAIHGGSGSNNAPGNLDLVELLRELKGDRLVTRDHRTNETVPAQRGSGSGTDYDAMLAAGDFRGIIEAARTDPAAKKFLQDNAQAVQLAIQDDSFLKTTISNVLNAAHQGDMSIVRNIQA